MRENRVLRIIGIVPAVLALIGLAGFLGGGARNAGAFLCPGILAAVLLRVSWQERKE